MVEALMDMALGCGLAGIGKDQKNGNRNGM